MAREKVFWFKQFSVLNYKAAMKVGTDGVLLGAWCDVSGAQRVLDVGTGCGLIALMVAQRYQKSIITAIDIDQDAIIEAKENFLNSPWSNRVDALVADFNDYSAQYPFDLIVSNPPFFTENVLAHDHSRNLARHTESLTLDQLISRSHSLLCNEGRLAFISPVEVEENVRQSIVKVGMSIKRLARVVPLEGAAPKRLMWELVKNDVRTHEELITIAHGDASFTEEYVALTRDFYLKM